MDQIYNKYGDESFWQTVIDEMYDLTTNDRTLKPFFIGKDVNRIKCMHNILLLAALKRDSCHFPISVYRVHKSLEITEEIFNRYVFYYQKSLKNHGIQDADIESIINILLAFKPDLVKDNLDI